MSTLCHGLVSAALVLSSVEAAFHGKQVHLSVASTFGNVGKSLQSSRNATFKQPAAGKCGVTVPNPPHPSTMKCPDECPYVRPDTVHFCSFACVAKQDCDNRNPLTSFADPATMMCSPCSVTGCMSCGSSQHECVECGASLHLNEKGECVSRYLPAWHTVYAILAGLLIFVVVYLIQLALRPVVNERVLARAANFRHHNKLFTKSHGHCHPYPLDVNLCAQNVSGAGIQLHFSWQRYMIIWAAVVMLIMHLLTWIPLYSLHPPVGSQTHPNNLDVFETCAELASKKFSAEMDQADQMYLYVTIAIYVFSTFGTFWIMVHHRSLRDTASTDKLRHFVLAASGFPSRKGSDENNSEDYYKEFFERVLPDAKVKGVSIVWETSHSALKVRAQIADEIDDLEREEDQTRSPRRGHESVSMDIESLAHGHFESRKELRTRTSRYRGPEKMLFHGVDDFILSAMSEPPDDRVLEEEDLVNTLNNLESTGTVYIVFHTRKERHRAFTQCPTLDYEYTDENGDKKTAVITLERTMHDCECYIWKNLTKKSGHGYSNKKLTRMIACVVGLAVGVTVWSFTVYLPIQTYLLSATTAPGVADEHKAEFLIRACILPLPIMISNQILYYVCDRLSNWVKFATTGSRDLAYVAMYTVFITYQTILDLYIAVQTAYGKYDMETWKLAQATGVLGPKAIAQNPTIRDTLYLTMVTYLFPGTLAIPYLVEPLFMGIAHYYVMKWLIGSRDSIGVHDAENLFQPMPFDLSRYGDIMVSIMCCILVCFIASPEVWKIFMYLLGMLLFCYCWDHWRVLRLAPRHYLDDHRLDDFCVVMLALPCALLASAVVFRKYGAHNDPYMNRDTVPGCCIGAFVAHIFLHMAAMITYLVKTDAHQESFEDEDAVHHRPWEHVAKLVPYNWFNTNWVHCLRSKYIRKDKPVWCRPAKIGREYLLKKAPELGLHFEVKDAVEGYSLQGDFHAMSKHVGGAFSHVTESIMLRKFSHPDASPSKTQ